MTGIGRIGGMKRIVERLAKENKLRTVQGKAPRLYLTEFGYLNRPINANTAQESWHREAKRAIWLDRALKRARDGAFDPGMFVFYKLIETPPANPALGLYDEANLGQFDTGVAEPGGFLKVTGARGYGKGDRTRRAYCAIRAYAKNPARGYPILGSQPGQPDQCP